MKKLILIAFSGFLSILFAQSFTAVITKDSTGLYASEKPDSAARAMQIFSKGDKVTVIPVEGNVFEIRLKVRTDKGAEGWVQKEALKETKEETADAKKFQMEEAKIVGFLEHPQAIYIFDMGDASVQPILVSRSFGDLLIYDIDKETFNRLYDEKLNPDQ